jgi:transposase-like protein
MKTYRKYSEYFKEQALTKVYSRRNDQSIQDVASDLNICLHLRSPPES